MSLITLRTIDDPSGRLTAIEGDAIPFPVRRVFYITDVPAGASRGGHAQRTMQEVIIAISGSFDVSMYDEHGPHRWQLNRPTVGLHVPANVWRSLSNFSSNSVALVLASTQYDEADYIRDFELFKAGLEVLEEPYFERRAKTHSLEELQGVR